MWNYLIIFRFASFQGRACFILVLVSVTLFSPQALVSINANGGTLPPSSFQEGGSPTPQLIETTACDCGSVVSRKLHWQRVSIMGNIWNSRSRNVNWRIFPYFFYLFTEINKHFACSFMLTTVNWTDNAWRYQSALLFAAIVGMWTIFPVDFFYVPLVLAMLIYKGNNLAMYQPESR